MINIFKTLGIGKETTDLADKAESNIAYLKSLAPHGLSTKELLGEVEKLQDAVKQLKREGISVWNASSQIPKIFDIVDGAFVIIKEVIKNQGETKE